MLLPNDTNPECCLYYAGAKVLQVLLKNGGISIDKLYIELKEGGFIFSYSLLCLSLDWLYLIGAIIVDEKGGIELRSLKIC